MESSSQHMTMTIVSLDIFNMMTNQEKENYLTWYRENVVLKRVVELTSCMFRQEINTNFTQDKLELFLRDNKTNINNIVEELMKDPEELEKCIMDIFDEHINIEVWISRQELYELRKKKGKKHVEWTGVVRK